MVHRLKPNYFLRAAAVLLIGSMLGLCTIPGTLSRYNHTQAIATNRVRAGLFRVSVARGDGTWVEISGGDLGEELSINLFETLKQEDVATEHPDTVLQGEEPIIAPGTGGIFKIEVMNFSEVSVEVSVASGTPTGGGIPIEWLQADGSSWGPAFPGVTGGNAELAPLGGNAEFEFTWRWRFDRQEGNVVRDWFHDSDTEDTDLGVEAAASLVQYSIPLTITAAQID